ncbi:MAG: GNAT family N-acetyltransferase [Verrucomicrobiales bacterium]|nr:GNAT family N-acetyltransferase [Verrucomicrobiales bacterium]
MDLVASRLEYVLPPSPSKVVDADSVSARVLKNNETEFREYFKLRQKIYTVMGYLDESAEECCSQLEINESDTHAIHVGAFYRSGAQKIMVGTARVVTNSEGDEALGKMFEAMLRRDIVLKRRLLTPYRLGLPIFQSHYGMNEIMGEALRGNQLCGELSRVTVAKEFRGSGISRQLVETALQSVIMKGARRLFLECLEIHESMYAQHGFVRIKGVRGSVVDVGRTMIAMQLAPHAVEQIRARSVLARGPARIAMPEQTMISV